MAQTRVQGPDGGYITVEHPEGASDESILRFAAENYRPTPIPVGEAGLPLAAEQVGAGARASYPGQGWWNKPLSFGPGPGSAAARFATGAGNAGLRISAGLGNLPNTLTGGLIPRAIGSQTLQAGQSAVTGAGPAGLLGQALTDAGIFWGTGQIPIGQAAGAGGQLMGYSLPRQMLYTWLTSPENRTVNAGVLGAFGLGS